MSDDLTNAQPEPVAPQTPDVTPAPEPTTVAPEVATTVAPEATPEPELDLSWLDDVGAPEPQSNPGDYGYVNTPDRGWQQPPMPQYPPQQPPPQAPQTPDWGNDVNAFVDTRARAIAQEMMRDAVGPVAVQLQRFQRDQEQQRVNAAEAELNSAQLSAKQSIKNVLSKDKAYREDPSVQKAFNAHLQNWINWGYQEARATGDRSKLQAVKDAGFLNTMLWATKGRVGYQPNAIGPAQPSGAELAAPTPPVNEPVVELPSDMEAIAQQMGPAFRERLVREMAVTQKAGDYEDYEG